MWLIFAHAGHEHETTGAYTLPLVAGSTVLTLVILISGLVAAWLLLDTFKAGFKR